MKTKLMGIITDIFPTETFPSGFAKRVFWLKQPDSERYPEHWKVELQRQDVEQLNRYQVGDHVTAEVEVRGKKWDKAGRQDIILSLHCIGLELRERPGQDRPKRPVPVPPTLPLQ